MAGLKDLELLILSRYPIIAVETYEEERVEAALQAVTAKLQIPLFVWTVTDGLRRRDGGHDGATIYDTQRPIMALANLASIKGDGVYHFKDLHRQLGDAEVVRRLQDLTRLFAKARRAVVLSAPRIELPLELEKLVALFRLELPTKEELKRLATASASSWGPPTSTAWSTPCAASPSSRPSGRSPRWSSRTSRSRSATSTGWSS
jgi:hypothetical protein